MEWEAIYHKIGPQTQMVIERLLANHKVEQQAYNGCRSILKLADIYSAKQLEETCKQALEIIHTPRYQNIKKIIQTNQTAFKESDDSSSFNNTTHAILRGSHYYGEENNQ